MVELDYDQVLTELKKLPTNEQNDIPEMLEQFLQKVAKNGEVVYSWDLVKPLFLRKLESVMETFSRNHPMSEDQLKPPNCVRFQFEDCKRNILSIFSKFTEPPFTTQRLSEILVDPGKHYRRLDKLMRGIERNVLVVSPLPPMQDNYWDDYQKESSYKDLYTNCSLSNSFKAAFEESDDVGDCPELIANMQDPGAAADPNSQAYDSTAYSQQHSLSNSFYEHHIQQSSQPSQNPLQNSPPNAQPAPHQNVPNSVPGPQQNSHMLESIVELQSHSQSTGLAPLQQLDSFTNVFASNTTHLTHLSSGSAAYSLDASMSSTSWSSTHLKGPYEDVIQTHDDAHGEGDENIIVDDEESEDEEEAVPDSITKTLENGGEELMEKKSEELFYAIAPVPENPRPTDELSVNIDRPEVNSEVIDEDLSLEIAMKKRLSPTPINEQVITGETEESLTPKKIKIAEQSPESSAKSGNDVADSADSGLEESQNCPNSENGTESLMPQEVASESSIGQIQSGNPADANEPLMSEVGESVENSVVESLSNVEESGEKIQDSVKEESVPESVGDSVVEAMEH